MNDEAFFQETLRCLVDGRQVVSAVICSRTGSAPRSPGARMLMTRDGTVMGSVGGGVLESEVIACMKEILEHGQAGIRHFSLSASQASKEGLICGGNIDVLMERIDPELDSVVLYEEILKRLGQARDVHFITVLDKNSIRRMLWPGNSGIPDYVLGAIDRPYNTKLFWKDDQAWVMNCLRAQPELFIFGAGHVGRHTALLSAQVGFEVTILDDRQEFADPKQFPSQIKAWHISEFSHFLEKISISRSAFVLIMTRGHAHDAEVLSQVLKTPACYIGMIGSVRKRDAIFSSLSLAGVKQENLSRVHCPVGLSIGAETPEEIAVSVVAQLIQVRAKLQRHLHSD
ncbi:XdhC family protein [Desulfonatronovibrio magnus]|uniref:XdhC family protein n=1 Tax=Desulfonatronovibrio magnus TaxID=698827 RepID=UPI000696CE69|nr:XdhC/CoxI family protein [Desulfonatronovibrio magnus]